MKTIVVKTQTEFDSLPNSFKEPTVIEIRSGFQKIHVTATRDSSHVVAMDSSRVVVWGSSRIEARDSSSVEAKDSSRVVARDSSCVEARDSSRIEARDSSRVVARDSSGVVARDSSCVEARDSSRIEARDSSSVEARDSSRIEARDSSRIEAKDSSHVVARDSSSVEAKDSSHIEVRDSSCVVARDYSMIAVLSSTVVVKALLDWSVASLRMVRCKIAKKSKTATVIRAKGIKRGAADFFARCASDKKGTVILWKSVNPNTGCDFKTGKIKYSGTVECPDWNPDPKIQCGNGLHLSPTMSDALNYNKGKLLKCRVAIEDIVVFPSDTSKVRCRKVEVLE